MSFFFFLICDELLEFISIELKQQMTRPNRSISSCRKIQMFHRRLHFEFGDRFLCTNIFCRLT